MRNPGTVFLYYWKKTAYSDAHVTTRFFSPNDTKNHLGFWPLIQTTNTSIACKACFTDTLETDYLIIGLRALSYKTFLKKNIAAPLGIGVYLGIIDALTNFELSDQDDKNTIEQRLFAYAENWKVGFELESMQLSPLEKTQLTILCDILAEKITGLSCEKALIEEIVYLGSPTACIQLNNLNVLKMEDFFQSLKKLYDAKKLNWCTQVGQEKGVSQHQCASIIFELFEAGGISDYTRKYKTPRTRFFQKVMINPDNLYAMAKHVVAVQEAPEKQGCTCSMM
ncbi:MAG: hypothetical protein Q8L78_08390 [Coxiellaceae bacterium]|nr:hypothetical protein [Coxiellaceae bacterium]